MIYHIEYVKDVLQNNYLGVKISPSVVEPFLQQMKEYTGDKFEEFKSLQQQRDHGQYHITVINVMEYGSLSQKMGIDTFINSLEAVFDYPIDDLKLMGIGRAERGQNCAYYIVVNSDKLQQIRQKYGLESKDFHITLGFRHKDVHGVRKNEILKQKQLFLKLLSGQYYKSHETFDFLKDLENFELDPELDIEPIKISDTNAIFRCGENDYFQVATVDDKLRVVAKWQDSNKLPIISNTLIAKKFNS